MTSHKVLRVAAKVAFDIAKANPTLTLTIDESELQATILRARDEQPNTFDHANFEIGGCETALDEQQAPKPGELKVAIEAIDLHHQGCLSSSSLRRMPRGRK